jgi:hypothetical protein
VVIHWEFMLNLDFGDGWWYKWVSEELSVCSLVCDDGVIDLIGSWDFLYFSWYSVWVNLVDFEFKSWNLKLV